MEGVPVFAFSRTSSDSGGVIPTVEVHSLRDDFKMRGVAASSNTTQMVDCQSIGDRSNEVLVREPVGQHRAAECCDDRVSVGLSHVGAYPTRRAQGRHCPARALGHLYAPHESIHWFTRSPTHDRMFGSELQPFALPMHVAETVAVVGLSAATDRTGTLRHVVPLSRDRPEPGRRDRARLNHCTARVSQ